MWKYVLKRIGLALVTAFIILSLTFILMRLLPFQMPAGLSRDQFSYCQKQYNPEDPSKGYLLRFNEPHEEYGDYILKYSDGDINNPNTVTYYFYTKPALDQYWVWIKNIITKWEWGTSTQIQPRVDAIVIIGNSLPTTIKINIISVLISVPIGILLGIIAALKKNKPTDHIISTLVMVFISIPNFVLITFVLLLLCYRNQILPSQWPASTAPADVRALAYIIPVFCLSFGSICGYCRFTRAELCEVMSSEYLLLARTKGLTKKQAIVRHALRNAMVPIIPSILAEFIGILGGSMILESLYGIPGIGSLFIKALNGKDYNVLMVDMAIFTTIGLIAGIIVDISYGFIDPRIRMGAKK